MGIPKRIRQLRKCSRRRTATRPVSALKNIGPATSRWLAEVGITTERELNALGAVGAYQRLQHLTSHPVTLTGLYALEGALRGVHWNALDDAVKQELRRAIGESQKR